MSRLSWILILILTLLTVSTSGCVIGVKERVIITYVGFAKTPEEANGAIKIATNKKIPVTVVGENDLITEMDLGGFLAVRETDFVKLVELANMNGLANAKPKKP